MGGSGERHGTRKYSGFLEKKFFPNFDQKIKRMSKLSQAKQQQLLQTSRKNR